MLPGRDGQNRRAVSLLFYRKAHTSAGSQARPLPTSPQYFSIKGSLALEATLYSTAVGDVGR